MSKSIWVHTHACLRETASESVDANVCILENICECITYLSEGSDVSMYPGPKIRSLPCVLFVFADLCIHTFVCLNNVLGELLAAERIQKLRK